MTEPSATRSAPSPVQPASRTAVDDARLQRLEERVLALTARVVALERTPAPKAPLFRRKKG